MRLAPAVILAALSLTACKSLPPLPRPSMPQINWPKLPPRYHPAGETGVQTERTPKGEETLNEVSLVRLTVIPGPPRALAIEVTGTTPRSGYTNLHLRPVNYIRAPADGIYDMTLVGTPPGRKAVGPTTSVKFTYTWSPLGADVKGVRIHGKFNSVVAMIP